MSNTSDTARKVCVAIHDGLVKGSVSDMLLLSVAFNVIVFVTFALLFSRKPKATERRAKDLVKIVSSFLKNKKKKKTVLLVKKL